MSLFFENRRKYSNYLNPELFDFGERGIEMGGVSYEDVPELNFSENEVMEAPKNVDFVANLIKGIKLTLHLKNLFKRVVDL